MAAILVVDDISGVHEMLDIVFEGTEFTLEHAYTAEDGLREYQRKPIDLVLADVQMPGANGLQMVAELKEIDPDVVVVVTTASDSREFIIQALRLGAFDFVQKPYEEEVLLDSVRRGIEESGRRRQIRQAGSARLQGELQRLKQQLEAKDAQLAMVADKDSQIEALRQQLQMREERDLELRKRSIEMEAKEGAMRTMETVIRERRNGRRLWERRRRS